MCYIISDNIHYLGTDFRGRPSVETKESDAHEFKSWMAAENFLRCLPEALRRYKWKILDITDASDDGELIL